MAESCQYCGVVAVIDQPVEGGREQKVCIECGSLAADNKITSPVKAPYFSRNDDFDTLTTDELTTDSMQPPSFVACISCGITLDSESSLKDQFCEDCSIQEEVERQANGKSTTINNEFPVSMIEKTSSESLPGNANEVSVCDSCGSRKLSHDTVNGDERLVCTDCGMVCSEELLVTDREHTSSSKYHSTTLPSFAKHRRVQQGLIDGIEKISNLCSKFHFSSALKTEAENMFRNLYLTTRVRFISIQMKEYVAAVCLFIVCRHNDLPITLRHFERHVGCYSRFIRAKKYVVKTLNIPLPNKYSLARQTADLLQHLKLGSVFIDKVNNILFLFRRAWLTGGRSRPALISLAAYYAYISSDQSKKFLSRRQFLIKNKLPHASWDLGTECYNFLCKLACLLPWLKSKVMTQKTLPWYINSILEYQESLFHLAFQVDEETNVKVQTCDSGQQNDRNANIARCSGKELLLVPPCSKKTRVDSFSQKEESVFIPSDIDLDCPNLQENEFEDEINSYILSPEERERVREDKLNKMT